jgi:hypothetical protein
MIVKDEFMFKKVKFYERGRAYFGDDTEQAGFIGDVDSIPNAVTIVLIKPNTPLEDVKRSLEITLQDVDLRIKQENDNKRVSDVNDSMVKS